MIPSRRLSQNSTEYQNVPDDPADWASMMQQWAKIRNVPKENRNTDLPASQQSVKPIKSEIKSELVEWPSSPQLSNPVKSEVVDLHSQQMLKPVKSEIIDMPISSQNLPLKSEIIDMPTSSQILQPVKSEVVDVPTLPILKPTSTHIVDFPTYLQLLKPIMSDLMEGSEFDIMDSGEPRNVVTDVQPSTSKEKDDSSKIRKKLKKKKKEKKMKPERSRKLKPVVAPSKNTHCQQNNVTNTVSNNFDHVPKTPKRCTTRFSPTVQHSALNPPSKVCTMQEPSDPPPTPNNKTKDKIMEESMQKIKEMLLNLLMETTENQVRIIAREELRRAKAIAQSVQKKFSFLSSLSGKLGLNIYDSDDNASEKERNEKNQAESDEELQTLINRRQRNFQKTEMQIDLEIESSREKKRSIAYQNKMKIKCVTKIECEKNKVDVNKHLKATPLKTNNTSSNTTTVVPKPQNLIVNSSNEFKKQHQTNGQQKTTTPSVMKENGVVPNLNKIRSTPDNLSSSSSTLSPSSLSSTTSYSSDSSSSFRPCHSKWDSDSDRGSRVRLKSKRNTTSSRRYSRYSRSPSKEYRRTIPSSDRRSQREVRGRHSTSYPRIPRGDSPTQFRSRRSPLRSERQSSKPYWKSYYHSPSESRRLRNGRIRR